MKIVIGIMKDNADQVQSYIDQGYHVEYIDEHVEYYGNMLMKINLTDEEIQKVRQSGYKVSSRWWTNVALVAASEEGNDKIVIADLQEEDHKKVFSKII
jgi:hypothetical protein